MPNSGDKNTQSDDFCFTLIVSLYNFRMKILWNFQQRSFIAYLQNIDKSDLNLHNDKFATLSFPWILISFFMKLTYFMLSVLWSKHYQRKGWTKHEATSFYKRIFFFQFYNIHSTQFSGRTRKFFLRREMNKSWMPPWRDMYLDHLKS